MNCPVQHTNIFAMFQKNPNCYYPCVRIDFTQIKDHTESTAKQENVFKKIIPSYNNDGLYFTDAFVLESQNTRKANLNPHNSQALSLDGTKQKFDDRIQKQNDSMDIQQIYEAEPDSLFCQICRGQFQNYHDHIQGRDHIRNLEFSKGYKFIKVLCKQAQRHLKQSSIDQEIPAAKPLRKSKQIQSEKVMGIIKKKGRIQEREMILSKQNVGKGLTKCCEHDETSGSKRDKNDKMASIINSEMKQSAVEKVKIQSIK